MFSHSNLDGRSDEMADPLLEQMRNIQLGRTTNPHTPVRRRRFSDSGRPVTGTWAAPAGLFLGIDRERQELPCGCAKKSDDNKDKPDHIDTGSETAATTNAGISIEPHVCTAERCSILTVFQTTELLESILSYQTTSNVLNLRRVNRHWDSTIQGSPYLRLHFFSYPQWQRPGADFELLPLNLPGLDIARGEKLHLGRWIIVTMTLDAAYRISPEPQPSKRPRSRSIYEGLRGGLGSKKRDSADHWPLDDSTATVDRMLEFENLFVTQPPLPSMQAFIRAPQTSSGSCGQRIDDSDVRYICAKLSCEAGVTLGFLAEAAHGFLTAAAAGPSSTTKPTTVMFKAIMSFTEPPPKRKRATRRHVMGLN